LTPDTYPKSYYAATATPFPLLPALAGTLEADVCVIGGGFTGLSAALHLAEAGYKTVLLEARRIAWGASGRNGGQINIGYVKGPGDLIRKYGRMQARQLFMLAEEGRALIRDRTARHGFACDLKPGTLLVASKPGDLAWMAADVESYVRDFGYDKVRLLDRAATLGEVGSTIYHGAIADSGGGHLHPLNYALGIARTAMAAGAGLYEGTPALKIEKGPMLAIKTPQGVVRARYAVLGCDSYLDGLEPRIESRIMPISNYIIATEPLPEETARALIPHDVCIADTKFVVSYFRLSADRRLLFGGGEKYTNHPPRDIAAFVRPYMLKVFPQLADARIDYGWGGQLALTISRMPHAGRLDNIFFAHGFSGQGVAIANIAGKLIAEALAGTAERFDVLASLPHRAFPGGAALRHPLLVLAMLWYALRDRL